ncbi:hypothetical protein JKP88DRAFT_232350 [Tribonema minus]|uniref:Uncharacterized protein n=1 Tax=Tribonema minus TaxID=303371 RepID=A0A836CL22_9STRA|nr:hypothetical protein JKP88DRAFT_232350 [Tribonema minus]
MGFCVLLMGLRVFLMTTVGGAVGAAVAAGVGAGVTAARYSLKLRMLRPAAFSMHRLTLLFPLSSTMSPLAWNLCISPFVVNVGWLKSLVLSPQSLPSTRAILTASASAFAAFDSNL